MFSSCDVVGNVLLLGDSGESGGVSVLCGCLSFGKGSFSEDMMFV